VCVQYLTGCLCLSGIKSADQTELALIATPPQRDYTFFVGDFKLLNTLLSLVGPRVCSSSGGVYASDGKDTLPYITLEHIQLIFSLVQYITVYYTIKITSLYLFPSLSSLSISFSLFWQRLSPVPLTSSSQARPLIRSGSDGLPQGGL
jgi:hypothetical protein